MVQNGVMPLSAATGAFKTENDVIIRFLDLDFAWVCNQSFRLPVTVRRVFDLSASAVFFLVAKNIGILGDNYPETLFSSIQTAKMHLLQMDRVVQAIKHDDRLGCLI